MRSVAVLIRSGHFQAPGGRCPTSGGAFQQGATSQAIPISPQLANVSALQLSSRSSCRLTASCSPAGPLTPNPNRKNNQRHPQGASCRPHQSRQRSRGPVGCNMELCRRKSALRGSRRSRRPGAAAQRPRSRHTPKRVQTSPVASWQTAKRIRQRAFARKRSAG